MSVRLHRQPLWVDLTLPSPVADVFAGFLDWPDPVLLESSLAHPHLGRYSYIAAEPFLVLTSKNGRVIVEERARRPDGGRESVPSAIASSRASAREHGDPFAELQELLRRYRTARMPGLPPFQGGAVGYFAYDLGRHLERLPRLAVDDLEMPDLYVGLYSWVIAHDHLRNRTWLIVNPADGGEREAAECVERVRRQVGATQPPERDGRSAGRDSLPQVRSSFTREAYLEAVATAKAYIREGDIYQVCLSQRLVADLDCSPWRLYRHLRSASPVPYGAYLGFRGAEVASASPELFLRLEAGRVETRPIKGTRPRGRTPALDAALAEELRHSEKDRAENLMIVDLLRNDLGRACRIGSVGAPEIFGLETYSTVHHLVSTVRGELRPELDAVDLLRACFPGGSVTGCPKIRALEIIEELEPTRRGVYCGAIGYLGFDGDMDTSIVIRTAVVRGGRAYYQVGGAIVADSDPDGEYQETLDKARAFLVALGATRRDVVGRAADPVKVAGAGD